jgi:hypothetical protein
MAPRAWVHLTTEPPGFTNRQLNFCGSSWAAACESKDLSPQSGNARVQAALRLLFWHAIQPLVYFWAFEAAAPTFGDRELFLARGVYIREVMYFVSALLCTAVNPAFLLVDVAATVSGAAETESSYDGDGRCYETRRQRDEALKRSGHRKQAGIAFLLMYVISPEIYTVQALCGKGGLNNTKGLVLAVLATWGYMILDWFGVFALRAGFDRGHLIIPAALAVSYGAATLVWVMACIGSIYAGVVACKHYLKQGTDGAWVGWLFISWGIGWLSALVLLFVDPNPTPWPGALVVFAGLVMAGSWIPYMAWQCVMSVARRVTGT